MSDVALSLLLESKLDELLAFTKSLRRPSDESITSDPADLKLQTKEEMGPELLKTYEEAVEYRRSCFATLKSKLEECQTLRKEANEAGGAVDPTQFYQIALIELGRLESTCISASKSLQNVRFKIKEIPERIQRKIKKAGEEMASLSLWLEDRKEDITLNVSELLGVDASGAARGAAFGATQIAAAHLRENSS
jgi:hypothetical protein